METEIKKLAFASEFGSPERMSHAIPKITDHVSSVRHNPDIEHAEEIVSNLARGRTLDSFLHHPDAGLRMHAAKSVHMQPHMVDEVAHHGDYFQRHGLVMNQNVHLNADHIHSMIDFEKPDKHKTHPAHLIAMMHHDKLNDDHWHKLATHPNKDVARSSVESEHMPIQHILTAKRHPHTDVRASARVAEGEHQHRMDIKAQEDRGMPHWPD